MIQSSEGDDFPRVEPLLDDVLAWFINLRRPHAGALDREAFIAIILVLFSSLVQGFQALE